MPDQTRDAAQEATWDRRGFWALILTMFQGAFNDNLYKYIIIYYLFDVYADPVTMVPPPAKAAFITSLGAVLFSLPYLLFPGITGALADRYSKRSITIATKGWEVVTMVFALVAFLLHNEFLIWTIFLLLSIQTAFFSPAKYGILPEILPAARLSWGNGVLNMGTFVAIVMGTAMAGPLFDLKLTITTMSLILIGLSLMGLVSSTFVSRVPAAEPDRRIPLNPWSGLGRYFRLYLADQVLFLMLIAGAYFWFVGSIAQQNVPVYAGSLLGLSKSQVSTMVAFMGLGIGCGSIAAGYLSRRKIELGLVPLGLAGMAVFNLLLGIPGAGYLTILALLFLMSWSAGFYIVPVHASIQHRSPEDLRGGMIATYNVMTSVGIFSGGALYMLGGRIPAVNPYHFFLFMAAVSLVLAVYLCFSYPLFLFRAGLWALSNTLYRVRAAGCRNVPEKGGALLVAPRTCFVDALVITASLDRQVWFALPEALLGVRGLRFVGRMAGTFSYRGHAFAEKAAPGSYLDKAAELLKRGEVVCVFRDGLVTPSGETRPFQEILDTLRSRVATPIIPVYVDPLLGNVFGIAGGRIVWQVPREIPYTVAVSYGAPMLADTPACALTLATQEAATQAYQQRLWNRPLLHRAFIRTARCHPRLLAVADARMPGGMSFFKTLVASIILARKLKGLLGNSGTDTELPEGAFGAESGQRAIRRLSPNCGVLVPPSVGGALTNVALQIMGKVPVNLNYTASAETMAASARQAGIRHVITARAFLEKLPLQVPGEPIYLEDIMATVTGKDRVIGLLLAVLAPVRWLERHVGSPARRSEQDAATIIFSSGSEGEPKGVVLTHFNVMSNIDGILKIFPHVKGDRLAGILPFFHSFGFTVTLWAPLVDGIGAVYHPSPLEARAIGKLIEQYRPRIFVATPTFLLNFIRRCAREELSSLKYILAGAEKLTPRIRDAFVDKFGVEPIEGYGATECAPVVCANTPDFRAEGFYHRGNKYGTIGYPLPGVAVRVVDADTRRPLPPNAAGLFLVKGPNVMKGYLNMPERTAEAVVDGWYVTGDIVSIDEDGFITITDRLARFSKLGGEMVPHIRVEEALHELLGLTDQSLAVAAVPDPVKGERLVVLHTLTDEQLDELLAKLDQADLPNLWRPRPNAFYRIEAIPVLGTGKMDIKAVKAMAQRLDLGE